MSQYLVEKLAYLMNHSEYFHYICKHYIDDNDLKKKENNRYFKSSSLFPK